MKINSKKAGEYLIFLGYLLIGFMFVGLSLMFDIRTNAFWGLLIIGLLFILFSLLLNRFMIIANKIDKIISKFD